MVQGRLEFPNLTKHSSWAAKAIIPWRPFLSVPNEVQEPKFVMCFFQRLCAKDLPTLYLAMITLWGVIALKSARGASWSPKLAHLFALAQFALSCTRLVVALDGGRKLAWFRYVWRALPPEFQTRDLAGYSPAQLQALIGLPSLRAHVGPSPMASFSFCTE